MSHAHNHKHIHTYIHTYIHTGNEIDEMEINGVHGASTAEAIQRADRIEREMNTERQKGLELQLEAERVRQRASELEMCIEKERVSRERAERELGAQTDRIREAEEMERRMSNVCAERDSLRMRAEDAEREILSGVYIHTYIHVHIYIHIHVYVYIYIYIYMR